MAEARSDQRPVVMDYKSAGVDVPAGRDCVDRIKGSVHSTRRPEVIGGLGGFGGIMRLPTGLRQPLLVSGTDGVGTKLELAQDHQSHPPSGAQEGQGPLQGAPLQGP